MLPFLLVVGSVYALHKLSMQWMIRSFLFQRKMYEWLAYGGCMAAGTLASLSVMLPALTYIHIDQPVALIAVIPTFCSIALGESLHTAIHRTVFRMGITPKRSDRKGQ